MAFQAARTLVLMLEVPKSAFGARQPPLWALVCGLGVRDFGESRVAEKEGGQTRRTSSVCEVVTGHWEGRRAGCS